MYFGNNVIECNPGERLVLGTKVIVRGCHGMTQACCQHNFSACWHLMKITYVYFVFCHALIWDKKFEFVTQRGGL